MKNVVIALGSNVGDRLKNIELAAERLGEFMRVRAKSEIYETLPVGFTDQENFLNAAVFAQTDLDAEALLERCQALEIELGRTSKPFKDAPRAIDLDIVFFEGLSFRTERLCIPHPRWKERDFVITPLIDLMDLGALDTPAWTLHREFLSGKTRSEKCRFTFRKTS